MSKTKAEIAGNRSKSVGLIALAGALACGFYVTDAAWAEPAPAAPAATATAAPAMTKEEADSAIYERQQVMIQLDKDAEMIGRLVAGEVPPDKLAEVTQSLADGAKESAELWKATVPGGDAKPEVWTQHDDFKARMDKFAVKSAEMAKIAKTGNMNGVIESLVDAMPCKECHDVYRVPKKKPPA